MPAAIERRCPRSAHVACVLAALVPTLVLAVPDVRVAADTGRISLRARAEPVDAVLGRLADEIGFSVKSKAPLDALVTVDIEAVTLAQALARVLSDLNHVLIYDDGGPVELRIYPGKGQAPVDAVPALARRPSEAATRAADTGEDVAELLLVLNDPGASRVEQARALKALTERDEPEALGALVHALGLVENPGLKMGIIRALGRREDDVAVTALGDVVDGPAPVQQKLAAVRALGEVGTDSARGLLARIAETDDPVGQSARQLLEAEP